MRIEHRDGKKFFASVNEGRCDEDLAQFGAMSTVGDRRRRGMGMGMGMVIVGREDARQSTREQSERDEPSQAESGWESGRQPLGIDKIETRNPRLKGSYVRKSQIL
jgi:hypothetical protein